MGDLYPLDSCLKKHMQKVSLHLPFWSFKCSVKLNFILCYTSSAVRSFIDSNNKSETVALVLCAGAHEATAQTMPRCRNSCATGQVKHNTKRSTKGYRIRVPPMCSTTSTEIRTQHTVEMKGLKATIFGKSTNGCVEAINQKKDAKKRMHSAPVGANAKS